MELAAGAAPSVLPARPGKPPYSDWRPAAAAICMNNRNNISALPPRTAARSRSRPNSSNMHEEGQCRLVEFARGHGRARRDRHRRPGSAPPRSSGAAQGRPSGVLADERRAGCCAPPTGQPPTPSTPRRKHRVDTPTRRARVASRTCTRSRRQQLVASVRVNDPPSTAVEWATRRRRAPRRTASRRRASALGAGACQNSSCVICSCARAPLPPLAANVVVGVNAPSRARPGAARRTTPRTRGSGGEVRRQRLDAQAPPVLLRRLVQVQPVGGIARVELALVSPAQPRGRGQVARRSRRPVRSCAPPQHQNAPRLPSV